MKKIYLLSAFILSVYTLQAQIVNEGTLKIEPGTEVVFMNDYTNKVSATHDNEGNLHLKGNFTNNGTMTPPTSGTTYFDSAPTDTNVDTQTIDGDVSKPVYFYNLTINNTHASVKGLEVLDKFNLQVANDLALTSGNLRLMGEAQLIQTHTGVSQVTGNGHLLKDQDAVKNAYQYQDRSSPVHTVGATTYKATTILKDGTTADSWTPQAVGWVSGLNGSDSGSPIQLSTRWFYRYENAEINPSSNSSSWLPLFNIGTTTESANAELKPGEGFTMKGTNLTAQKHERQNYTFEGTPNDGDYTLTIGNTNPGNEYLVGNPYPSALDLNRFVSDNAGVIDGTIYFYEHWSTNTHFWPYYGGGYASWNGSGGTAATLSSSYYYGSGTGSVTPNQYVSVGQGFYVRTGDGGNGGDFTFNNSQRVFKLESESTEMISASTKHRSAEMQNGVTARIRMDYISPNGRARHLLFAFTDGSATDGFDSFYDGRMFEPGDDDMYFVIDEGDGIPTTPYVIEGVGSFNKESEYPIVAKTAQPGKHTIVVTELENFNHDLYLLDENGRTHALNHAEYDFITHSGEDYKNFKLVFKPATPELGIVESLYNDVNTYFYEDEIMLFNPKNIPVSALRVYNTLGQLVYETQEKSLLNNPEVHIPFAGYAYGAYIIKLQTDIGTGTYKFLNN